MKNILFTNSIANYSKNVWILPVLLLASLLWSAPTHAVNFTAAEKAKLKSGRIVRQELPTSRKNGFYGGTGWAIIDAPAEIIWKTLLDFKKYNKIFSYTEEAKVLSRKDNKKLVRLKIGHPILGMINHMEMKENKTKHVISFKLVNTHPHDLQQIRGYWRLFPQKDGKTLVAYVIAIKVPMGLVNLASKDLENTAVTSLIGLPLDVKWWIEKTPISERNPD